MARLGYACFVAGVASGGLQSPESRTLSVPDKVFDQPFTRVSGIHEFADGRILAVDGHEATIWLIDPTNGATVRVGRNGRGPGEYLQPGKVFSFGTDTALIVDRASSAMLLASAEGPRGELRLRTLSLVKQAPSSGLRGVDRERRFYVEVRSVADANPARQRASLDSISIERRDSGGQRVEIVARVASPVGSDVRIVNAVVLTEANLSPFATENQWVVDRRGRVVIVYHSPYRAEIVEPNGSRLFGPLIRTTPIAVTEQLKAEWRKRQSDLVKRYPILSRASAGEPDWPSRLPPFLLDAVSGAPDGMTWVQRTTAIGAPIRYDIIGSQGTVVAHVSLDPGSRVVGWGRGWVYVARADEDGIEHLERFAFPAWK